MTTWNQAHSIVDLLTDLFLLVIAAIVITFALWVVYSLVAFIVRNLINDRLICPRCDHTSACHSYINENYRYANCQVVTEIIREKDQGLWRLRKVRCECSADPGQIKEHYKALGIASVGEVKQAIRAATKGESET